MNYTKQQLEDIWNSRELNWVQRQSKASRKKTARKIRITFFEKKTVHVIEEEVWMGKKDSASSMAYGVIMKHYATLNDWPSKSYEVSYA